MSSFHVAFGANVLVILHICWGVLVFSGLHACYDKTNRLEGAFKIILTITTHLMLSFLVSQKCCITVMENVQQCICLASFPGPPSSAHIILMYDSPAVISMAIG